MDFKVDFICIGPERSGTTWLYQCLKEHPGVCMSEPKELSYFNSSQSFWRKDLVGTTKYSPDLKGYREHFSHCVGGKVYGEVTPEYIHSPEVPERLKKHFPHVKLIAILRDPTERLFSHYMYTKLKGVYAVPSFEEVVEQEKEFVDAGMYFKHLQNYLAHFPKEQLLVLFYDDIEKRPKELLKEVFSFVGVDASVIPSSATTTINSAGATLTRKRLLSVRNALQKIPFGSYIIALFKKTPLHKKLLTRADTRLGTATASYGSMDPKMRTKLHTLYAEDIRALEQFTGRDLSHWR